jgi:WD40 repeat protein
VHPLPRAIPQEYSELHKKAVVWAAKGKPHDQGSLLVGEEIEQWTSWLRLANHYSLHPQPVELQKEYVRVSSKRSSSQRKQRRIGFLVLLSLILLGACASIALAIIAEASRADLQVLFKKEEQLNTDLQQLNEDLDQQAHLLEQSNAELEAKGREVQQSLEREMEANQLLVEQINRNRVITRERMIATLFLLVKGQSPESPSELRAAVQACGMARVLKQTTQVTPLLYPILAHVARKRAWKMGEFFGHSAPVLFVAESPDGRRVATGSQDGAVGVWKFSDPVALPSVRLLEGKHSDDPEDPGISAVSWSPDSRLLISAAYTDPIAWVWTVDDDDSASEPVALIGHTHGISSAAFSPSSVGPSTRIATGSFDFTVRVWSVEGLELDVLEGHNASLVCLEWSPDGERLVSGSDDDALVVLWDLRPGATQKRHLMYGHVGWVNSVAWRPDGAWLASGSDDQTVALWSVPSDGTPPTLDRQLFGHESYVNDVAWSQDGLSLASASYDFNIRVWHFAGGDSSGRSVGRGPRPISQDNNRAVPFGDGLVRALAC